VSLLSGRFVLVREIGSGGMSTVFLGRDEVLDRPVAVKILRPDLEGSDVSARFRREGRTAARLSHPNVVQVYDAREEVLDGRETSYIVVEYVPGGDLKALIDKGGPLPGPMLSRIGAALADGLAHAHERGIIHRDLKPQNVLIDEYGSPKLTDFGIARALDAATRSTSTDSYLGTASYSSPEQLKGEKVTPKSDVYSLGATLYHAAVGGPPFTGDPLQVASQQLAKPPVPPRARGAPVGEHLEALILGCLAKEAADRPDAAAVHDRLLRMSEAVTAASASAIGASGATGLGQTARSVGAACVKAVRRGFGRRVPELSGPPESTISLPTRTFRAGSGPRRALASAVVTLFLLFVLGAGGWALFGPNAGGQTTGPIERIAEPQRNAPAAPAARRTGDAGGDVAAVNAPDEEPAGGPALPPEGAERAVFDMYYEMSFARPETSYSYLSERLQQEIGSPEQWAEQEDIYSFTYMEFTQYPNAAVSGETAEVTFEVRLDRTYGSELLSGTWVCVVEDAQWRLDRLENESVQTL
jgi:tRNA A-37 threonylcarbamoyl transferase component Bud32